MLLLQRFKEFILKENLFQPADKLLLAVSGGVDSTVLCDLCRQAGYNFSIAHCNFKLRGEESERDKKFVASLAEKYNAAFFLKEFETVGYAEEKKLSIQEAARELRYYWFNELLADKSPAQPFMFLLTAHHLDDNIETLLMNFFKGTGIAGLRAILPKQRKIVRPLLFARKDELVAYALENKLEWVDDSSNEVDKYTRNYFRHQIIPFIQKVFPQAEANLENNLQRFRDIELLYGQAVNQHKKNLLEHKGNEVHVPVLKLKKLQPLFTIIFEIIKDFGFTAHQVTEAINLLNSDTGKYLQSPTHLIIKNRAWLIITPVQTQNADTILIEEDTSHVHFAMGRLQFEKTCKIQLPSTNKTACLNAAEIKFPLLLRPYRQGDYFYPFGMKKKKKLSRFFIDQKLSKADKEKVWVLEMNKKILWVIGQRIDDRFKITDKTKEALTITFIQSGN